MMVNVDPSKINKADVARAHRDRFLQKVRQGEMSAEEFLLKICGVPSHRVQEMRVLAGL